jgi:hypothetical protein
MGWVWSRGSSSASGPLGSVAGDDPDRRSDRHRGWLLSPSPSPPYRRLPAGG